MHLSTYLSIYLYFLASIYLPTYLSIYLSILASIYLSISIFIYIYLYLYLSISCLRKQNSKSKSERTRLTPIYDNKALADADGNRFLEWLQAGNSFKSRNSFVATTSSSQNEPSSANNPTLIRKILDKGNLIDVDPNRKPLYGIVKTNLEKVIRRRYKEYKDKNNKMKKTRLRSGLRSENIIPFDEFRLQYIGENMQKDKYNEVVFAATTRIEGNLTATTQAMYHIKRRAALLRDRKVQRELVSGDLLRRVFCGTAYELLVRPTLIENQIDVYDGVTYDEGFKDINDISAAELRKLNISCSLISALYREMNRRDSEELSFIDALLVKVRGCASDDEHHH